MSSMILRIRITQFGYSTSRNGEIKSTVSQKSMIQGQCSVTMFSTTFLENSPVFNERKHAKQQHPATIGEPATRIRTEP